VTKFADLHIHTYYSDSTLSPQEVVNEAVHAKLACISIADHDTIEAIEETRTAAEEFGLEVIPGIELSSEIEGKDVHILGYFIDPDAPSFREELAKMQQWRIERIKQMIENLRKEGINNIEDDEVLKLTRTDAVGRPHLAAVLKEKGWVSSIPEAFNKYLGEEHPAYVTKYKQTPYQAIELIRNAGGIAVLAHPMVTQKDELIPDFVKAGLQGLEVYYPNYSNNTIQYYGNLARKHGLVVTGGSDAHGDAKSNTYIGRVKLPYQFVEELKELRKSRGAK
jgi:predicted metal-dependent phosphoesterase TrpH